MPYAVNNGVRIHYHVEGDGPPLLLHVGFMVNIERWYQLGYVDALRNDFRLLMLDPRGQGASDKPHGVEDYAIQMFVSDIVAVLDAVGIARTHFLGYSMGAQIGFAAGVYAPERFTSLILGGGSPYFSQPSTVVMPSVREEAELLQRGMSAFVERVEQHYGPLPSDVRAQWLDNDGEALAANTLAMETYPDITQEVSAVTLPTMIYCGTEDEGNYEAARRASEAMPNARFVSIDGLDHLQAFFRSDLVLPHVRAFLKEVGG
jgi:pimeloyl-ACP methyl ester carboxylesterase